MIAEGTSAALTGIVMMLVWIGIVIYLIGLVSRFVRAVERIADKFDGRPGA